MKFIKQNTIGIKMPNKLTMLFNKDGDAIITHVHQNGMVVLLEDITNDDKKFTWSPYLEDGIKFQQQEAEHIISLYNKGEVISHTYTCMEEFLKGC